MRKVIEIKSERAMLLHPAEACQLISAVTAIRRLRGDLVEVGVAYGASAKLIATYASESPVHLFDTSRVCRSRIKEIPRSLPRAISVAAYVQSYLAGLNVAFYPGLFPETAAQIPRDLEFKFVHLDLDLYDGTLAALRVFYPRMVRAGSSSRTPSWSLRDIKSW
jgi:O-methyltransferase